MWGEIIKSLLEKDFFGTFYSSLNSIKFKCHCPDPALPQSCQCSTKSSYCYSSFYVLTSIWTEYSHFSPPLGSSIIRMYYATHYQHNTEKIKSPTLLYSPQIVKHNCLANVLTTDLLPWLLHVHSMNLHTQESKAELLAAECSVNCYTFSPQRIVTAVYFQRTLYCRS